MSESKYQPELEVELDLLTTMTGEVSANTW